MIQIQLVCSECGPSNLVVLALVHMNIAMLLWVEIQCIVHVAQLKCPIKPVLNQFSEKKAGTKRLVSLFILYYEQQLIASFGDQKFFLLAYYITWILLAFHTYLFSKTKGEESNYIRLYNWPQNSTITLLEKRLANLRH